MSKVSDMTDREWRKAVEDQRHVVDELEEREDKQAKLLKATKTELKSEKNKLARILRGEDPEEGDDFVDGDTTPELPFAGKPDDGEHDGEDKSQGDEQEPPPKKSGKGKRGRGPQGVVS